MSNCHEITCATRHIGSPHISKLLSKGQGIQSHYPRQSSAAKFRARGGRGNLTEMSHPAIFFF